MYRILYVAYSGFELSALDVCRKVSFGQSSLMEYLNKILCCKENTKAKGHYSGHLKS